MNPDNDYKSELKKLESDGLKRTLAHTDNFRTLNFSSNDYLGLSRHPEVMQAAMAAVQMFGTGGTSSRLLAGTQTLHTDLERALAIFLNKPAALVFSSGYHTNTGIIPVLAGAGDLILVDRLCHASIMDGIRLSEARFATFEHNDMEDLEKLLTTRRAKYRRALVITEGVFSMDGDVPPLRTMVRLTRAHDARLYLDEAHSLGVMGPEGRGWAAHEGVLDQIDVLVGTLSKSLGSQGGFVAGSQSMVDLLISRARSFIYTTALAPAAVGAALASLRLLPQLEERRRTIREASEKIRSELTDLNYLTGPSRSHIIPVLTGDLASTQNLSDHLFTQGFFVPSIRPPTVPVGEGRVRLSITFPVVEKGWTALIGAFASNPHRSPRTDAQRV